MFDRVAESWDRIRSDSCCCFPEPAAPHDEFVTSGNPQKEMLFAVQEKKYGVFSSRTGSSAVPK